ncbi:MAG: NAD(P)/FAD-dependent oxidoreductase [Candidatus Cloacimonetes bacterium]|nr:NAD(P)/FAD-dependent oxidoreductase [Candidatus Cloacimonadota bacterium]
MYDVIVIGGGAAGLMAAGTAVKHGRKTLLIEKNPVLGKKLLITGKGRCNLTNYCDVPELIENIPRNGKFLINAFHRFSSEDTVSFFNDLGLATKIERGNRVFPASDKAKDVVERMIKYTIGNGVEVIHNAAREIMKFGNLFAVKLINDDVLRSEKIIIATGGKSYPGTGSTGDGYKFARQLGHKTTRFKPSLVPIEANEFLKPCEWLKTFAMVEDQTLHNIHEDTTTLTEVSQAQPSVRSYHVTDLQDLTLKNVGISLLNKNGKKVYKDFGEMLFTHFGVSGPVILSASSHVKKIEEHTLVIDLKPALDEEKLDLRLQRDFKENSNKEFQNILKNLLPSKMIPVFIELSGIPAKRKAHQINREERKQIGFLLKNLTIKLEKFRPIKEAIITSGGVEVKEINPKTMESKIVSGLFFAGEVIDVDGHTGGFNLQIAWSTGFVAGMSC